MTVRVDGTAQIPKSDWYHIIDKLTRIDELLELSIKQNSKIIELLEDILNNLKKPRLEVKELIVPTIPDIINFVKSDQWHWSPKIFINQIVPPYTKEYTLYEAVGRGWFYYARMITDNPDIRWVINIKADETIEVNVSIREIYEQQGLEYSEGFRILKYDDVNRIYCIEYTPGLSGFPGTPFRDKNKLYLINPTGYSTRFTAYVWLIEVV